MVEMRCRTSFGRFVLKGYPTIVHLSYGKNRADYSSAYDTQSFVDFVKHVGRKIGASSSNLVLPFVNAVTVVSKRNLKDHTSSGESLVMFFEKSCEECEDAKSTFNAAAEKAKSGSFVSVDCTQSEDLCKELHIENFPTFKVFIEGKAHDYLGKRSSADFINAFAQAKLAEHAEL